MPLSQLWAGTSCGASGFLISFAYTKAEAVKLGEKGFVYPFAFKF